MVSLLYGTVFKTHWWPFIAHWDKNKISSLGIRTFTNNSVLSSLSSLILYYPFIMPWALTK